jgi:hypothetical protein
LHPTVEPACSPERRCRRRECPCCGPVRRGDEYRKFLANIGAHGRVLLVSITGPGADVLPWDDTGARVVGPIAYAWNITASARYARLWKAATLSADRLLRRHGYRGRMPSRVAVVWAPQKRGVWHVHEALPANDPRELMWSRQVVRFIDQARKREAAIPGHERWLMLELERCFGVPTRGVYGFGFIDRNPMRAKAAAAAYADDVRAAAYLARNVAGYLGDNASAVMEYAVGRRLRSYVSRRLTMQTGVTMRSLRHVRWLYVCLRDGLPLPDWTPAYLEAVWALLTVEALPVRGP